MAIPLDVNGVVFQYPVTLDEDWGAEATAWASAVTDGMLQLQGGSFPITANINFGPNFGLLSQYFSTRSALPSTVGTVRLSSADAGIGWRNNANSGNLILTTNASDQLLYNGFPIATSGGGAVTSINGTANQIIASSPTGAVTLSTPQDIAPASSPTFASLTLTAPLSIANGGTGQTSFGVGALSSNGTTLISGTLAVTNGGTGTTTSTGTGSVVLSTSPTITSAILVTPALGTPSSGTLTNATGLPIDAGTTGTLPVLRGGTGTTTSTGTGSVVLSNSPTLVTPALGTPSSVTLTNGTGLPIDGGTTGTLPVSRGGTGDTSLTAYAVLAGGTTSTNPVQSVAGVGITGQVLTSNGAGALPTFQNTAGSGTVNSGTSGQVAYYAATGSAVSGTSTIAISVNQALFADGTVSLPAISFASDPDTGIYRVGANNIAFASAGGIAVQIDANKALSVNAAGAATQPDFTFIGDTDTGVYRSAANVVDIACGGASVASFASAGVDIKGTTTNDSAAAGYVGEVVSSAVSPANFPADSVWGDLTSISLTAGDWLVSCNTRGRTVAAGPLTTTYNVGISTTAGNSTTGLTLGDTYITHSSSSIANDNFPITVVSVHIQLSATTTTYLKYMGQYTSTAPTLTGRITAVRIR